VTPALQISKSSVDERFFAKGAVTSSLRAAAAAGTGGSGTGTG
jgi:hypothetical protein